MSDVSDSQYKSIRARVYRWAFRLLQNEHDALDATQTVLLKALRVPPAELDRRIAWLRRITINHCIDEFRRRRPTATLVDAADETEPDDTLEQAERSARITAALQDLTDLQRVVLLAKAHDGESFEDIARSLGISASSVKTHYLRALRKMHAKLAPHEGDLCDVS